MTQKRKFYHIIYLSLVLFFLTSVESASLPADSQPEEVVQQYFSQWQTIQHDTQLSKEEKGEKLITLLNGLLDIERVSQHLLPNDWNKIHTYQHERFKKALSISLKNEITSSAMIGNGDSPLFLQLKNKKITSDNSATLDYRLSGNNKVLDIRLFMNRDNNEKWQVSNIQVGKKISLTRHYYQYCKKLLDNYSLSYLIAELGNYNYVVLEDFEEGTAGAFPPHWRWKSKDDNKRKPYVIRVEDHNHYLEATDEGESVIIGKSIKWNLKKYRYVSFRWRVHRIPPGGDERYGKTVDSAAGIYFIYKKKMGLIPESVKYVWSSTLPVGSAMRRSGVGKPWMVVADSGTDHLGEWRTYVFDAYQAYKDTFGGEPPETAIGIGILSDANSTHSQAYADYDDIRAVKEAKADSGVKKILQAE